MLKKDHQSIEQIEKDLTATWNKAYMLNKRVRCGELLGKIEEALMRVANLKQNAKDLGL